MILNIHPETQEEIKARNAKCEMDASLAGRKAIEILKDLDITHISTLCKEGGCIRFYKNNKCVNITQLPYNTNSITLKFYLCNAAEKLSKRKRFRTVEENTLITDILLDLYSTIRKIDQR